MFAVRFDPNQGFGTESNKKAKVKPIIPLKRTNNKDHFDEDYEDAEENQDAEENRDENMENEGDAYNSEATFVRSDDSDDVEESSEEEPDNDQFTGLEDAFEEKNDIKMADDDTELDIPKNYSSVLSRFQTTMKLQDKIGLPSDFQDVEELQEELVQENALQNIPQPEIVRSTAPFDSSVHKSVAWLHTRKIHYDNSMIKPFDSYSDDLEPKILNNIKRNFAMETFPIQTVLLDNVLPVLNFALCTTKKQLTRRVGDILVNASTGSGKTLAYSIPIVQMLSKRTVNKLRVLIVLPTKLLINQVYETIRKLSQGKGLVISMSKLDVSLKEEHNRFLQNEPDILIITPGRLVDHLNMNSLTLKNLKMLVLDEADHLLNQSFQNWCPELMSRIKTEKSDQMPGNVIKMIFSATLTTNTEKLHGLQLYNPKLFVMDSVKLYNLPAKLQEYNISIPTAKSVFKPLILLHLLNNLHNSKILVFVKSNEASLRLASLLKIMMEENIGRYHEVSSINSNNTKGENKKLVNDFTVAISSLTKNNVLITTDLMSRGIDINDITDVINYDLPIGSQQYVHRNGRTARAQTKGNAYNMLVGKGERNFWKQTINEDISRDINGCSPIDWVELETSVAQETQDSGITSKLCDISADENTIYKQCLEILKQKASTR